MPTLPTGSIRVFGQASGATSHPAAAGASVVLALLLAGAVATGISLANPLIALAFPVLAAGGIVAARRPAPFVVAVFLLTGLVGTLTALTPMPVLPLIEFLLASLWIGALGTLVLGHRSVPTYLWPALVAPALYVFLTTVEIALADSIGEALRGFRLSTWYMALFLLIALAPWSRETLRRIVRGVLVCAVAIGAYCLLRYLVGPASAEEVFARASSGNYPTNVPLRFYGSFAIANQLSQWGGVIVPFALALALGWRGRWRIVALALVPLCTFLIFASDVRIGLIAAVAGSALVLGLHPFARAFPSTRFAHAAGVAFGVVAIGVVFYSLTVARDPESTQRFANLLSPTEDFAYVVRLNTWDAAWNTIAENPLGVGVGTSGSAQRVYNGGTPAGGLLEVDSTYLKIALEQGLPVMVFFLAGLLFLLVALCWRAIAVSDPERAALGIGAAGVLLATLLLFYAGIYIDGIGALPGWILLGLGLAGFTRLRDEA